LVPSHTVVVDIDFSQHAHHFELKVVSLQSSHVVVFYCFVLVLPCTAARRRFWKRKGVRDFQNSLIHNKAEKRTSHHLGKRFVAMFYNLKQGLIKK
jgi:hypothetical protein